MLAATFTGSGLVPDIGRIAARCQGLPRAASIVGATSLTNPA